MEVRAHARLVIQGQDETLPGAFGPGCVQLLEGIDREKSLNRAAKALGMAYSKAWRIIREAEAQLGCDLLARDGARGSTLTPDGERVLSTYRQLQIEVDALLERRLPELLDRR